MNVRKDIHAHALVVDEAVFQLRLIGMGAAQLKALRSKSGGELLFHLRLGRPAHLVGGLAQVATGQQNHFIGLNLCRLFNDRNGIG